MVFDRLRERIRFRRMNSPEERLRRVLSLLPEDAFRLEGMEYSRAEIDEWLQLGEFEVLVGAIAGIGAEYEDQRGRLLPDELWSDLYEAGVQLGHVAVLEPFLREGKRIRGEATPSRREGQNLFLDSVASGRFVSMRDAGQGPVAVGYAAVRSGASEVDTVRLLRELFSLDHAGGIAALREAQRLAKEGAEP